MSKKEQYLIFGSLAPLTGATSGLTTQLAVWLAHRADVTVVISDQSPCSLECGKEPFSIARERQLGLMQIEKQHKRLYVLGDDFQSLWAHRHYLAHGGLVLAAAKTLSNLHRLYHEQQNDWPNSYIKWLQQNLGTAGAEIALALSHHRRESKTILREIPIGVSGAAFEDLAFIEPQHILKRPYLASDAPEGAADNENGTPTVAVVLNPSTDLAIDELLELDKETLPPFHLNILSGNESNLAEQISAADIVLVLDTQQQMPLALLQAISLGKPLITCSQGWLADLPFKAGLNISHPEASHELKASLGALLVNQQVLTWASEQSKALFDALPSREIEVSFFKTIHGAKHKAATFAMPPSTNPVGEKKEHGPAFTMPQVKRPFALVGAVPPPAIAEALLPFVDCSRSPRFATPEIVAELCGDNETYQANKLALLGYEAPIIGEGHTSWMALQPELQHVKEAICFGPHAEGTIAAESFIGRQGMPNFTVAIDFEAIDTPGTLAFQSKKHGLYWRRDAIEQSVEAILVAGLSGTYKCSLKKSGLSISLSQTHGTHLLTDKQSVTLNVDQHGILKFHISVYDSSNMNQLTDTLLINSLAKLTLNLEWLGYGQ